MKGVANTNKSGSLVGFFLGFCLAAQSQNNLDYYISAAKANSPLINDNKTRSEATRIEIERLKAVYTKPQVGLAANYLLAPVLSQDNGETRLQLNPTNPQKYIGYDYSVNNGGMYQGLVGINQPLFGQQKFDVVADEATISTKVNENNIKLTEHEIEKIITDQYILCLQDGRQIDFIKKYISLLQEQKDLVAKLVNASIVKLSDLSLLNIELQTQVINLNTSQTSYRSNLLDLNVLSGINDTSIMVLPDVTLQIQSQKTAGSSFITKFSLDSATLIAQQKVFELRYKPQVSVFANSGLNAVNISTLYRRFGVNAGISLTLRLYDGKQKKLNQNRTSVLLKTSQFYKETFLNQNGVRKNKLLIELQNIKERATLFDTQLKEYGKLLEYYRQQLVKGQISVIDYVNTVKNEMALQKEFILLQTSQQLLINAYNYWNW
jgi:hypothetical protein